MNLNDKLTVYDRDTKIQPGDFKTFPLGVLAVLIHKESGLKIPLKAYRDLKKRGKWTIGIGHTKTAKKGMVITQERAIELFIEDLEWTTRVYNKNVKVELPADTAGAVCLFIFNIGGPAFETSTYLKRLNARRFVDCDTESQRWVYSARMILRGLFARRGMERALFINGLANCGMWDLY